MYGYVDPLYALAANPDGSLLATGDHHGHVQLWELTAAEPTATLLKGHTALVDDVAFSSDGRLLASAGHDNQVRLWNIATRECVETLSGDAKDGTHVVFHPNNKLLATSAFDTITLSGYLCSRPK